MNDKTSYSLAIAELEKILSELESNSDFDLELISAKVKRASELLEFCKNQLHQIDTELEKILEELD